MRWTHVLVALSLLFAVGVNPAVAQMGRPPQIDPPPEEPMGHMVKMMSDMRSEMQRMHGEMRAMMEQHRQQMQKPCPGSHAPAAPKSGG